MLKKDTGKSWFRPQTPIEPYEVSGTRVWVKREDLFGSPPAPPLGKLRGLLAILQRIHSEGGRLVGCWDTRVSKLGQGGGRLPKLARDALHRVLPDQEGVCRPGFGCRG